MYRLAIDTTSRRFASISRCLARVPSATSAASSAASASGAPAAGQPPASFSWANKPTSIALASSTSSCAVSSGKRLQNGVDRLRRQVVAIERGGQVRDRYRALLPGPVDDVCYLISGECGEGYSRGGHGASVRQEAAKGAL